MHPKIGPRFSGLMPSEIMDSASRNIEFWVPQRLWETSTKGGMDIPKKSVHPDRWKPVIQDGDVFFSPIPKLGERIFRFSHKFNYRGYKKRGWWCYIFFIFAPNLGGIDPI